MKNKELQLKALDKRQQMMNYWVAPSHKKKKMTQKEQQDRVVEIAETVCKYYNVTYGQVMSKYRGREVVLARQMAMYLSKHKTELKAELISQQFNRDRTTYLHSVDKIEGQMTNKFDQSIKEDFFNLNVLI